MTKNKNSRFAWKYQAVDFSREANVGYTTYFPKCCTHLETTHKSSCKSRILYRIATTYYCLNK